MASNIKFKRSAVQNRVPTAAQLELGELALNTYDGKLYTEINTGSASVIEIGSKLSSLVVDGDNGAGSGDVTFHGTTAGRDLTWDYSDNSLNLADNTKIKVGNGADLQIYHSGSHSFIQDEGTGNLYIDANQFYLRQADTDTVLFQTISNGEVRINHNGNLRLTTTSDGVDIGGTGSLKLPSGTTAQRNSSPTNGDLRYNTTTDGFEGYADGDWGPIGGVGAGGTWSSYTAGIATTKSVGVNTNNLDDNDLVGIGNSFQGLYISNGMMITDNKLSGNHYIGTAFNGLMAGPVNIEGTLTIDGNYVVV